jgi:alkane 1-monooxygenase
MSVAVFAFICTPWLLAIWGLLAGGWPLLLTPALMFVVLPVLDLLVSPRPRLPGTLETPLTRLAARQLPRLAALVHFGVVILGAHTVTRHPGLGTFCAVVFTVGASGGAMGIVSAHELVHRHRPLDLRFAELVLATVCHMHWTIEHLGGHHRNVGLARDPATARLGEPLYAFALRYLGGSYATALRLDRARAGRRMLWYTVLPPALGIALGALFGWEASLYFFVQTIVALGLLSAVNYIEHYGLERATDDAGRPEPIAAHLSWDSHGRLSGYLLLNLQLHSDHHLHPARGFERLVPTSAPELPTGYLGMFWLSLVPPLWRRVMDPAVRAARAGKACRG